MAEKIDWQKLSPEERDRLVAIKVMEWNSDLPCDGAFVPLNPEPDGLYCRKCGAEIGWGDAWEHDAPRALCYTQDMNRAWEVVRELHKRLLSVRTRFQSELYRLVSAEKWNGATDIHYQAVLWYLTPELICKAALLAIGMEVS